MFNLVSKYKPAGDQPKAIKELVDGIKEGKRDQVLLGATGTGKTLCRWPNDPNQSNRQLSRLS